MVNECSVIDLHGAEVTISKSPVDGTVVVEIDTPRIAENSKGPEVRVYLNDGCLFENPPFKNGRPNYDRCDERLQRSIDEVSSDMLEQVWWEVFQVLDSVNHRFTMTGDDAGRLAQICVDAIKHELPECLAK